MSQVLGMDELQLRADVYSPTGKLLRSFDVTAIPEGELAETLRAQMGYAAKETRVVQHQPEQVKGPCVMTVDRKSGMVAKILDHFPSRRAFAGKAW